MHVIDIACSHCSRVYHCEDQHLGKSIRCVQCGEIVLLIRDAPPVARPQQTPIPYPRATSSHVQPARHRKSIGLSGHGARVLWVAGLVGAVLAAGVTFNLYRRSASEPSLKPNEVEVVASDSPVRGAVPPSKMIEDDPVRGLGCLSFN